MIYNYRKTLFIGINLFKPGYYNCNINQAIHIFILTFPIYTSLLPFLLNIPSTLSLFSQMYQPFRKRDDFCCKQNCMLYFNFIFITRSIFYLSLKMHGNKKKILNIFPKRAI